MGVLNVAGYFDPLLALLDHGVTQRFVRPEHREHLIFSVDPDALVVEIMGRAGAKSPRQRIDLGKV